MVKVVVALENLAVSEFGSQFKYSPNYKLVKLGKPQVILRDHLSNEGLLHTDRTCRLTMTNEARKDSDGLPVEETLDKPPPFPLPERGDERALVGGFLRWVALLQQHRERVIQEKATQDPLRSVQSAQFRTNAPQTVRNFFAFFVAAVTGMLMMESEIPKEKIAQRNEMKEKEKDVTYTNLKKIESHKWNLEEKVHLIRSALIKVFSVKLLAFCHECFRSALILISLLTIFSVLK